MPELEYEPEQFITFPQEEQYYDFCFEYVSPLYISALQEGWSLVGTQDGTDQELAADDELPATVSKACVELCETLGLKSTLTKCLAKAKTIFSNVVKFSAEVDHFRDDQADNSPHVVIRVEVHSDQETALREYDQFVRWMTTEIPTSESHHFTITVRRV